MKNRNELPQYLIDNYCINNGIEIGSFEGQYSKYILEHWPGHLYLVDVWTHLDETEYIDLSNKLDSKNIICSVFDNVSGFEDRSTLIRTTSERASTLFLDNFFDFIYIDANHRYKYVMQDLIHWYPKLKVGGIMAGHDFISDYSLDKCNEDGDTHVWLKGLTDSEYKYAGLFGVNKAIQDFCNIKQIKFELTEDEYLKTWYFKKEK